ncbi:MAG: hypothetical protein KC729_16340, partial [Candidatus Eisenbacteria bacterium]|nr:hypothetical protein [Candidatus Eisenbacteria bacterium]
PMAADADVRAPDPGPSYVSLGAEKGWTIRVYPNQSGIGATAICTSEDSHHHVDLIVDGARYRFDKDGQADIPSMRGDRWEIELVDE